MTLPRWLARFNRRFINPKAANGGQWPVLVHVGRSTGTTYRTPIGAIPVNGSFVTFVNYGSSTDWLRNVLAAGKATLETEGETVAVGNPRVIPLEEGLALVGQDPGAPPGWVGVKQCLVVDRT
jgi:deazaflavin-dependent oxidoreductase (nitroreductase family)